MHVSPANIAVQTGIMGWEGGRRVTILLDVSPLEAGG